MNFLRITTWRTGGDLQTFPGQRKSLEVIQILLAGGFIVEWQRVVAGRLRHSAPSGCEGDYLIGT